MRNKSLFLLAVMLAGYIYLPSKVWALEISSAAPDTNTVSEVQTSSPVPDALRQHLHLSPFYQKYVDVNGLPVIGSTHVSDAALFEAADLVHKMLGNRDDILQALIRHSVKLAVMATSEVTTDIPEHSGLTPKSYWDQRARGLGGTMQIPVSSAAEENLLNLAGDRYTNESILIHEFSHTIHLVGLNTIEPDFDGRLRAIYQHAMTNGLWVNTYAATDYKEYWAEGVQSYFDANVANNGQHNDVNIREKLAAYDPELYNLIDKVFVHSSWLYVRYDVRHGLTSNIANNGISQPNDHLKITITNHSNKVASIYWLGANQAKLYRKLEPEESFTQNTYIGHHWQARFEQGAALDFIVPTESTEWIIQ